MRIWTGLELFEININILGGTVSGTNTNRPWDKRDPSPGQIADPSLGQTGLSLFNSTVNIAIFVPFVPGTGGGSVPGTIVPQGRSEKCLCVFCLLVLFGPNLWKQTFAGIGCKYRVTGNCHIAVIFFLDLISALQYILFTTNIFRLK